MGASNSEINSEIKSGPSIAPALRAYQEADVARIRAQFGSGARRVLYTAPTGSGKTVLFCVVVAGAVARGNRVVRSTSFVPTRALSV